MIAKLTSEQREALKHGVGPLPVEDEQTHEVYFLVNKETLEQADRDAIRQGITDMEAGRVLTLEEVDARIRARIHRSKSA